VCSSTLSAQRESGREKGKSCNNKIALQQRERERAKVCDCDERKFGDGVCGGVLIYFCREEYYTNMDDAG